MVARIFRFCSAKFVSVRAGALRSLQAEATHETIFIYRKKKSQKRNFSSN